MCPHIFRYRNYINPSLNIYILTHTGVHVTYHIYGNNQSKLNSYPYFKVLNLFTRINLEFTQTKSHNLYFFNLIPIYQLSNQQESSPNVRLYIRIISTTKTQIMKTKINHITQDFFSLFLLETWYVKVLFGLPTKKKIHKTQDMNNAK